MKEILIVEDSRFIVRFLELTLKQGNDLKLTSAKSLAEAIRLLGDNPERFFLALLDYNLPDAPDGEVIDYVLSRKIPTIVFSGTINKAIHRKIWSKGIIDFVLKEGIHNIHYLNSLIERLQKNKDIKVMVVDDASTQRAYFKFLLETHFYQVVEAENGRDALRKLDENPDVKIIITDYNMPKMDGFGLIRNIRKRYSKQQLAIIGVSSTDDLSMTAKFIKNGANDFINKPVAAEEFYCRILQNIEMQECLDDLREREQSVLEAKRVAEEATRAKSTFLANMSHEIRTPMNSILGFTEILERKMTDPVQKKHLSAISSSGKTLLCLINDILDLSKIESGKLTLVYSGVNPYSVFKEIEQIFSPKVADKKLDFIMEIDHGLDTELLLDEVRIRQILLNLVGNAVKFTDKGYIKVSAKIDTSHNDPAKTDLIFSVQDTGIGIPQNQKDVIFEEFRQTDGQNAKYGGTGLGLSISKRLVEMMNGELSLESEQGKGSTFQVRINDISLPVQKKVKTDNSGQQNLADVDFKPATILVVDDVKTNRFLIRDYLEEHNFTVLEAENGEECIESMYNQKPDLVLMDIVMPEMDGYETTKAIKMSPSFQHIPIVALTASVKKEDESRVFEVGMVSHLRKPISYNRLIQELMKYLPYSIKQDDNITIDLSDGFWGDDEAEEVENIDQLPALIELMENELMEQWRDVNGTHIVEDIERLARELLEKQDACNVGIVKSWAEDILNQVESFAIDELQSTLERYPELVEDVKKITEEMN